MPRLFSRAAIDRPQTTKTRLPPIPEIVWPQLPDTSTETSKLLITHNDPTVKITQTSHTPESQEGVGVESQTSPVKGTSPQKSGSNRELVQKKDTRSKSMPRRNSSQNSQLEIHETDNESTDNTVEYVSISSLAILAPQIEKMFGKNENTNELYMPRLSSSGKKDAVRPFGFQERPKNRHPSWIWSLCQCSRWKWTIRIQATSPHHILWIWRPLKFLKTRGKWSVRKINGNSNTQIRYWR